MTEHDEEAGGALARAAMYFSRDPAFFGYWLEQYRASEGVEPLALARLLGCGLPALDDLALCLCPREEQLERDTAELAVRFGADQDRLTDVLLQAKSYAAAQ